MAESKKQQGNGKRVVVLGAGPAGYPAAFQAADFGYDVTLIDRREKPGGVCLYVGCIPSKTLLHAARIIHEANEAAEFGIDFGKPKIDSTKLAGYTDKVVSKLVGGLGALAKRRNVRFLQGDGKFTDARHIEVAKTDGGTETLEFDYAIIATGSRPTQVPGFPHDHPRVMTSTEAMKLEDVPRSLLVVGGGYIGLELGTVYQALGSKVTVVEMLGSLLPTADQDLVEPLKKTLNKRFEQILTHTKVAEMSATKTRVKVKLLGGEIDEERTFEKVLVAVGRRPNTEEIGLEHTKITLDQKGFVATDHQRRTNERHIFAIGDVAGEPMLAHKGTYEARVAVEAMDGRPASYDPAAIPAVVFTDPEVAWCGLTENQAREEGIDYQVLQFPWAASGRATTLGRNDGLTKLLIDPHNHRVLGVGIVGVNAGELIAEGVLGVEAGVLAQDLISTIHPHPTLSETMMESAEMIHGSSTHYVGRR